MPDPVRTCVSCRRRAASEQLFRLCLGGDGKVHLAPSSQGRGAWVCAQRACLSAVSAKPRNLGKALRHSLVPAAVALVIPEARALTLARALRALRACAAAGLLRHGAAGLAASAASAAVIAVVFATDASPRARAAARALGDDLPCADVGLDRDALGRLVSRGPRAAIAVLAGKPGNQLALQLRRHLAIS